MRKPDPRGSSAEPGPGKGRGVPDGAGGMLRPDGAERRHWSCS